MKYKVKKDTLVEVKIKDGYYQFGYESYSVDNENIIKVCIIKDYASINTSVNEYDRLDLAEEITKDEFEAELEKAFEIIRSKLVESEVEI